MDYGCKLLGEYKGYEIPVLYQCVCGGTSKITLKKLRKGGRCKKCGILKSAAARKYSVEEVVDIFKKGGCELLSDYKNCTQPVKYRCNCGRQSQITLHNFIRGHRCRPCGLLFGEKNPKYNPDRILVENRRIMRNKCYGLLRRSLTAIKKTKNKKTAILLGYTAEELQNHLQSKPEWIVIMKSAWHLDHVFPIKAFVDSGINDIKIINCLENLRPVAAQTNLRKQAIYNSREFICWLAKKGVYAVTN